MEKDIFQDRAGKILVVEDDPRSRKMIGLLCSQQGYEVSFAEDGNTALRMAGLEQPDLILMDIMLPGMTGFDATERLKENDATKHIPILMVTSLGEKSNRLEGIARGASDYITKPFDMDELTLRIRNNLLVKAHHDLLKNHNALLESRVAERTRQLEAAYRQIKSSYIETIQKLNVAAEYKDEETGAHIRRISLYSREIAFALGMDVEFMETIYHASPMHDIGKVGIPDSIMMKAGALTPEEWEVMKSHTTIGAKILGESDSPFLTMAKDIALTHHERWDGSGYPHGLKGDAIPLSGRIVNIVDQYDALRSKRPYKETLPHTEVVRIITVGDGRTSAADFDPGVLSAFTKSASKIDEIFNMTKDEQKEAHLASLPSIRLQSASAS